MGKLERFAAMSAPGPAAASKAPIGPRIFRGGLGSEPLTPSGTGPIKKAPVSSLSGLAARFAASTTQSPPSVGSSTPSTTPGSVLSRLSVLQSKGSSPAETSRSPGPSVKDKIAAAAANTDQYPDIQRITQMPVIPWMTKDEHEEYCRANMMAPAFDAGKRLFETQSNAGLAFDRFGRGFFPIGVGWGKTLNDIMIANKAYLAGVERPCLFVPSAVLGQLVERDIPWIRSMIPVNMPINVVAGRPMKDRLSWAKSGKKGLYILTYPLLSTKDTDDLLKHIDSKLFILDEIHNLANMSAARTRRFINFVTAPGAERFGVGQSGTITSKSVQDYWHLIYWCLREYNPLPNAKALALEWGEVIDAEATKGSIWGTEKVPETDTGGGAGPLAPMVRWAIKNIPVPPAVPPATQRTPEEQYPLTVEGFRRAYKDRLNTAPGVVASGDAEIGVSLIICNRPVKKYEDTLGWPELEVLMDRINDEWLTPNGDPIDHAIHTWKWLYELSAGFYNELVWPTPEDYAKRKVLPLATTKGMLERAKIHHAAGQEYHKALRKWFDTPDCKIGMDTPMLAGNEMARNGAKNVGSALYDLWAFWHSCKFEGMPERDSRAVRVCSYKIDAVIDWLKSDEGPGKDEGCLIWVWHQELGEWAHEMLKAAGFDSVHCPAGADGKILDPANAKKKIVCSLGSHGTGKNLQHFEHQYYMQFPRSDILAEQSLGRTHRNGQRADELRVYTNLTHEFDELNFAACLNDALYVQQTTGNRQKLIYAAYDPLPKIFPAAVLRERGFELKGTNAKVQAALKERFEKKE